MGAVLVCVNTAVRTFLTRSLVAGCLLFAAGWYGYNLYREYFHTRDGRSSRRVDSYLPALGNLSPAGLSDRAEVARFLAYFKVIDHEFPATPGVQEMLGYCTYYSGDKVKAAEYFELALRSDGNAFAARYNLGVIYYLRADYEKSAGYFQDAISLAEEKAFAYVMGSRVFTLIRGMNRTGMTDVIAKIRQEYADAKRFIRLCMEKQGKTRELLVLAARYSDLYKAWSENGGQPETMELIVY
jgi:tetratricopeptide (TPR) repeat protein